MEDKQKQLNKDTEEIVLREAEEIYNIRKELQASPTHEQLNTLHKEIIIKYKNFSEFYMIVINDIIFHNRYDEQVMRNYIYHIKYHPWKNHEQFLEAQSHYLIYMYRKINPLLGTQQIKKFKDDIICRLREQDELLRACMKELQENNEIEEKESIERYKKEIRNLLKQK